MRRFSWLLSFTFVTSIALTENKPPQAIRVCVATLENSSRHIVSAVWQRDQLVKAFERINKSKEVKKGRVASILAIPLRTTQGPDPDVRDKDCKFVLYTNLTEVLQVGEPKLTFPAPGAVGVETRVGDPRAYPPDYHSATVTYRIVRSGDVATWASGLTSAQDQLPVETLVSQLMDQIAARVANELRTPTPPPIH